MIRSFNQGNDVDLLSAPTVTTKNGQNALIEVIREFHYPIAFQEDKKNGKPLFTPTEFATKNVGITLEAKPASNKDGAIELDLTPSFVNFIGFIAEKDGKKILAPDLHDLSVSPNYSAFSTSTGKITAAIQPGQTVLMGSVHLDTDKTPMLDQVTSKNFPLGTPSDGSPETVRHVNLIFVTASEVPPEPPPAAPPTGEIKIESHITEIAEEATWKKLCPSEPVPGFE